MEVVVRLFAAYREIAGAPVVSLQLPEGATVDDLLRALGQQCPALAPVLGQSRVAVNQAFAQPADPLPPGAEVALLPPVSGGADPETAPAVWLTEAPLSVAEVVERVADPACGAIVVFIGTVRATNEGRTVHYLEYEAYPGMAERQMAAVVREAQERFGVSRVALVHRLGRLAVGEASIIIAVAAPHRAEAFAAARYAIDRVKEIVPIWKKEVFTDGAVWIGLQA